MLPQPLDILILSNGPGEIMTWVSPVVQELRQQLGSDRARISVILSPCANATRTEAELAASFPGVDRVQAATHFFPFLLWGKTEADWDWCEQGVVLFLGGDQFFPVVIGKRLGYKIVIYAEWEARWARWVDGFGVMNAAAQETIPAQYQDKGHIVGDLMTDISTTATSATTDTEILGFLPGSKAMKLTQGVPYCLAVADAIAQNRPQTQTAFIVAPTLTLSAFAAYANPQTNPILSQITETSAMLVQPESENTPYLLTTQGTKIWLWTDYPNHHNLRRCQLCLTTIGANTAELGALGVPMIVTIPFQQKDAMRAWDGLPGLLANLPLVGTPFVVMFNKLIYQLYQRKRTLWAWPNIWAGGVEIVPEMVGNFSLQDLVAETLSYLEDPEKLQEMRETLRRVRGETGAAQRLVELVMNVLVQEA